MSVIDRRDFVKSISAVVGTASLAGISSVGAAADEKPGKAKDSGPGAIYEVFALKYAGPFTRKLAATIYFTGWTEDVQINYYIWAIRAKDGETTLVDTGLGSKLGPKFEGFVPAHQVAARLGIKPEQVTRVVLTHMHFDHVGGMEDFPNVYPDAKFYVQEKEFEFWVNSPLSKRPPLKRSRYDAGVQAVAELAKTKRLVIINGDHLIGPEMELLLLPGHSPGLQGVLIPTVKGQTVVGSDCAHLFRSYKEDNPSPIITDLPGWMLSYDKLRAKAPLENLFPGHDTLMLTGFPKVAEDITRLA
jgi:glyoxylase-like metal-dependent hydrolase (beta-lactamase superfamily II)